MATDPLKNLKKMGINIEDDDDCKKTICMDENDLLKKYHRKNHREAEKTENNK